MSVQNCNGVQLACLQAPHLMHMRVGLKMGDTTLKDSVIQDGLTDAFYHYHMGITGKAHNFENGMLNWAWGTAINAYCHCLTNSGFSTNTFTCVFKQQKYNYNTRLHMGTETLNIEVEFSVQQMQ